MTTNNRKTQLLKEINLMRKKLENYLKVVDNPTETEVVRISQELDKLIVEYYRGNDYA